MGTENEREQSEFNMAVSYLNRLNYLFYICDEAAMDLDAFKWFHSLMALLRELSTEMTPTEIDKGRDIVSKLNPQISLILTKTNKKGITEIPEQAYLLLHEFELFIRQTLKKSGLQNKMREDAATALK